MKLYRLYNLSTLAPASGLHFLKREDAEKYQDLVRWPYASTGRWPLPNGRDMPLEEVDLCVEAVDLPVAVETSLSLVLMQREGRMGGAALLPGDCFDPDEWQVCPPEELSHPVHGPLLERAGRRLRGEE